MTPHLLRQLWSLIETTQPQRLLRLDDPSLVQWLLGNLAQERSLNGEEADLLSHYIESRSSLIRDLAQQRLSPELLP
ncbi:hypothetical protein PMG71_10405 [Roseofilum sp. BLCC_M154]|jgi:hypothetical protein|uniref:Uncharacterized protein n=1 Tax=Roseofilum acuticapitatum BLCC-M154 TaxID=3022444 RepID=A0ABT7ATC8_9CYAN|nr:hypothetical protein [Roseofilum acuticapitatum]MDJ1169837.1 hypothetical protein [Roseofilum acuticapitatum BLCC-M154]